MILLCYAKRLIETKDRALGDFDVALGNTNRPKRSSNKKGGEADEQLQAKIAELETTVSTREIDVVAVAKKDWDAILPVIDSVLYVKIRKALREAIRAPNQAAEKIMKLGEENMMLRERWRCLNADSRAS